GAGLRLGGHLLVPPLRKFRGQPASGRELIGDITEGLCARRRAVAREPIEPILTDARERRAKLAGAPYDRLAVVRPLGLTLDSRLWRTCEEIAESIRKATITDRRTAVEGDRGTPQRVQARAADLNGFERSLRRVRKQFFVGRHYWMPMRCKRCSSVPSAYDCMTTVAIVSGGTLGFAALICP